MEYQVIYNQQNFDFRQTDDILITTDSYLNVSTVLSRIVTMFNTHSRYSCIEFKIKNTVYCIHKLKKSKSNLSFKELNNYLRVIPYICIN